MSDYILINGELYHHGIKGMKWGVRKDSKSYSTNNSKKLTSDQKNRIKKIAIATGVTVAVVAGVYMVNRYANMHCDKIIPEGKRLQHIAKKVDENFQQGIYATHLKSDNKLYKTKFADLEGGKFVKNMTATKNIKIAGRKASISAFEEFARSDDPFIKKKIGDITKMSKREIERKYDSFNSTFNSWDNVDVSLKKQYFSKLQEKGYDAVRDSFDQRAFKAKSPIILFDQDSVKISSIEDIIRKH